MFFFLNEEQFHTYWKFLSFMLQHPISYMIWEELLCVLSISMLLPQCSHFSHHFSSMCTFLTFTITCDHQDEDCACALDFDRRKGGVWHKHFSFHHCELMCSSLCFTVMNQKLILQAWLGWAQVISVSEALRGRVTVTHVKCRKSDLKRMCVW